MPPSLSPPFLAEAALRRRYPGDTEALVRYLDSGCCANAFVSGWTLLHWACSWNDISLVELLLHRGADLNQASQTDGKSALSMAVTISRPVRLVELLLESRAASSDSAAASLPCRSRRLARAEMTAVSAVTTMF